MVIEIRVEFGWILAIYAGLILFGFAFNFFTAWLEYKGYMEGITSLIVALGVALTLAPFAIISFKFMLVVVGGFISSGLVMIIGSISRYLRRRAAAQQALAELLHDADETSSLAGKRS